MCRVTERARTFNFYLFGGDLDFPEGYQLYIPNKLQPYFDLLETDEEDIEYALWEKGDFILSTRNKFAIFNQRTGDFLIFSISQNTKREGFFISLISCFNTNADYVGKESCPVLVIE
ncbi:MAG: hypothetical protein ACOCRV_02625 [bacterium]